MNRIQSTKGYWKCKKENPEKMKKAQSIFNDSIFGEFINAVSLESTNGVIKEPNSNKKTFCNNC